MAQGLDGVQDGRAINGIQTGQHAYEVTKARATNTSPPVTTKKGPRTGSSCQRRMARMSLPQICDL